MNRVLMVGETISVSTTNGQLDFVVNEFLGAGGSCIAYIVKYYENENIPHIGILKEYCPAFLDDGTFKRNGASFNIPEAMKEKFSKGLEEFKNTYKAINEYLSCNLTASNYHTVQIGLYEGNNTAYTLTSCDCGTSYNKVDNENLLSICKTMLSVTKAVELYHDAGFLHLDIKPKNILVLNDVADLIKLFDFDSLTSIEKLKRRELYGVPVPEDYHVPELDGYVLRDIGVETDIFEIGATLFLKVFKRAPEASDMSYDTKYEIDNNELFLGVSPQAKCEFVELLRKTLQISKRNRYKTTKELKAKLEKIISLISDKKPYLINLPKWQPSKYSVGRKNEIKEIKRRLDEDGYVFVKGIGGLGKSEIAKLYAETYKNEYHTVQFCKFSDNLKSVVATMPVNGVDEQNYSNAEDLIKEKNKILHSSDSKTLIIVDNFNVTYDDFLRDFLPADNKSFKVIFTTRCSMAAEYYDSKTYDLPKLSLDECKSLFFSHLSKEADEEIAEKLIEFVDYNTLIIVLMAIAIKKSGITLNEMLSFLENQEMDSIETRIFHEYDFSSYEVRAYNKIYSHLSTIFSISGLSDAQKEVLKNATLISLNGIDLDDFVKQCDSCNVNKSLVDEVVSMGWLNKDSNDIISMHPIISDMFSVNEELNKEDSYYNLAEYLEDFCNPDYCHFSIILNKLACAKHLERRYTFESDEKRIVMTTKLGRMYGEVYQPNEAREYLNKALNLAKELHYGAEVVYIYRFLGDVEKQFGTYKKAIVYYNQSILEGKKPEYSFHYDVTEAMMEIADCYNDNNDKINAYNSFLDALNYAKTFGLNEYLTNIAQELISLCEELGYKDREETYKKIAEEYRSLSEDIGEMPEITDFLGSLEIGDFDGCLNNYENILAVQREELGEDSPMYKDVKKSLWLYYVINNQKEQAMRLLNESFDFIKETSGEVSIEMAKQLASAAHGMLHYLDFDSIDKFAKRAIEICEENGATDAYAFVEANLALASSLFVQCKEREAKEYIDKIDFSAYSGSEFLADIVDSAGMVLCNLSEFASVEKMCTELIGRQNSNCLAIFEANILLASINEQRGALSVAESYAEEAKKCIASVKAGYIKNEWLLNFYRTKAKISYRKCDYEEAIKILDMCIDSFNGNDNIPPIIYIVYLERGLYHFCNGDFERSDKDYSQCEIVLKENNFPKNAFLTLYNNISISHIKRSDYTKAKDYLSRMYLINNKITDPETYFESVACNNMGLVEFNLGNSDEAIKLMSKAVRNFDRIGVKTSLDYYQTKVNLANAYMETENYNECYRLVTELREVYNNELDISGEVAIKSNFGVIYALLKTDKAKDAYDFSCDELDRFEAWFGKTSPIRIKVILQMGDLFKQFGFIDCYDFFFLADDLMEESKDFKSLNNAMLLNYIGCYLSDEKKEHGLAKLKFEESKQLFEELNATDDAMYSVVVNNIEYVKNLIMDNLIGDMAKYLTE